MKGTGVGNGDLGFRMIPGGAGFVFIPFRPFRDHGTRLCACAGSRYLFTKVGGHMLLYMHREKEPRSGLIVLRFKKILRQGKRSPSYRPFYERFLYFYPILSRME